MISLFNFEALVFSVQTFKGITQKLFQICLTTWKKNIIDIQSFSSQLLEIITYLFFNVT